MMRIFRQIFLSITFIGLLLFLGAFILGRYYEEEVTRYVIGELNEALLTEVIIENVELSFIKKFPDATLELSNVYFRSVPDFQVEDFEPHQQTDTLLQVRRLFLRFNLIQLFRKKYVLEEVQLNQGKLCLLIDKDGNGNYRFWNSSGKFQESFKLELEDVKFNDLEITEINQALNMQTKAHLSRGNFRGGFSNENYELSADISATVYEHSNDGFNYLINDKLLATASLSVQDKEIKISEGNLQISGQKLKISGGVNTGKGVILDLTLEGEGLNVSRILKFYNDRKAKEGNKLSGEGKLDFMARIIGEISHTKMPRIEADFLLTASHMDLASLPQQFRDISLEGSFSNGKQGGPSSSEIKLEKCNVFYGNSRLGGDFRMINFIEPSIQYDIKTELDLEDIGYFIPDSIFTEIGGSISARLHIKGKQEQAFKINKKDLTNWSISGDIRLDSVKLVPENHPFKYTDITGDFTWGDFLYIKNASGQISGNEFVISGRADNLMEYLLTESGSLWMDVDFYGQKADLTSFLKARSTGNNARIKETRFPDHIHIKSRFWFDQMVYDQFHAENVLGELVYEPRRWNILRLDFSSMDGTVSSQGFFEQQKNNQFLVKTKSDLDHIDIKSLFHSFNNFGQDFIQDKHLNGKLSGQVNFSSFLDEKMTMDMNSVLADCDLLIKDGKIEGFDPMMKLSRFIEVEELETVSFSTLKNQIFIRNSEVVIPTMDIESSAFSISGSGTHGFDKHFIYRFKVSLSEILSKKARRSQKENEFSELTVDDGLGRIFIPLIIEGDPDNIEIRYDRAGALQNLKEELSDEKQEVKSLLREEFGWFKKDSSLVTPSETGKRPKFILEWEEEKTVDTVPPKKLKKGNKSEKERFILEWEDK